MCVHKTLWPINSIESIQLLIMSGLSLIATTAGVGGGAIYSTLLMFMDNFRANDAFPISNFIILLCAITTFYVGVRDKMENPKNKFIDYDIVVVFCPTLLLGTKIGVILNKIIPSLILNILLILVLAFSAYKAWDNALKQKRKEDIANANLDQVLINNNKILHGTRKISSFSNRKPHLSLKNLLSVNDIISNDTYFDMLAENYHSQRKDEFLIGENKNRLAYFEPNMKEESNAINFTRIKVVLLLELLMISDVLIEGNEKIPSFFGINKCSPMYWLVFLLFAGVCIFLAKYMFNQIKLEDQLIGRRSNESEEFRIGSNENEDKINKILMICTLAGVIAGMLGVGGGIIMVPLMLELGIDPRVASTTSNFLLLFTSSAATCLFILSGQLIYDYAIVFGIICAICSFAGSKYITKIIVRTKKNSIIVFCLFGIMIISLIILPINGIKHAVYDMQQGTDIFAFNNFCSVRAG
jgi:uncharacterized membrane protein YfcA